MNNRRNLLIIALALVSGLLFAAFAAAQTGSSSDVENLLGAWNAEVTTVIQNSTFPALLTFDAGGGMLADEPGTPTETSGHGNWMMTGEGEVAFTFVALFSGEGGAYDGKLKVVSALEWDDSTQTWSGPFKIDIFDASDAVAVSDTGTFTLTRIEVEAMD